MQQRLLLKLERAVESRMRELTYRHPCIGCFDEVCGLAWLGYVTLLQDAEQTFPVSHEYDDGENG